MKPIFATVAFAAAIAVATAAAPQQPKAQAKGARPDAVVLGPGSFACSAWTTERTANTAFGSAMVVWVTGYLTAFNATGLEPSRNVTEGIDINAVAAQVDATCRANPTMQIGVAVSQTLNTLIQRKGYNPAGLAQVAPLPKGSLR